MVTILTLAGQGSWKGSKKLLYESFAMISNAIVETMPKKCIQADFVYSYSHNSSPESLEVEPVAGHPDGVGVQTGTDITALEEKRQTQLDTASSLQSVGATNDMKKHTRKKKSILWPTTFRVLTNMYKVLWVIYIEQDAKVQQYITVAAISGLRSKEVCDRAMIVYEVVKFNEKENPKKTYALKHYWRHVQADSKQSELYPSEGEIYAILDEEKEE
ncbi:hypothetical protein C0993_011080 [Termitomyces sp. T159_Od127]|nr:hypothetical protein C0993_011080 [Termitomyces sp. T159_Od127]